MTTGDEAVRRRALRRAYVQAQRDAAFAALGLDRGELDALLDRLDADLLRTGCDSTLRHSRAWAEERGLAWPRLAEALAGAGGHCDCEVLANVDPDG